MTQEEVLERVRQLMAEGYQALPVDDPARGMRGFVVFRMQGDEEQVETLEWPLFQGPLVPEESMVSADGLADFLIQGSGQLALCDDPLRRRVGFVRYLPEEGRAVIRYVALTSLKGAGDSTRAVILEHRDRLRAEPSHPQIESNP